MVDRVKFCNMKRVWLIVLITILLAGCGRRGALVPPDALVPAAVSDLTVAQQGRNFLVSWSIPGKEEGGAPLKGLAGFQLFRREVLPLAEDCEECPTAYRLIKAVDLDFPQGVLRDDRRIIYLDSDLTLDTTYQYKVLALKKDGSSSKISNRVRRQVLQPPPAPVVQLTMTPYSAQLSWQQQPTANAILTGYHIYRRRLGSTNLHELLATVTGKSYEDQRLQADIDYEYSVSSQVKVGEMLLESSFSAPRSGRLAPPE